MRGIGISPDRRETRKPWPVLADRIVDKAHTSGRATLRIANGVIHVHERGYDIGVGSPIIVKGIRNGILTDRQRWDIVNFLERADRDGVEFVAAWWDDKGLAIQRMIHASGMVKAVKAAGADGGNTLRKCQTGTAVELGRFRGRVPGKSLEYQTTAAIRGAVSYTDPDRPQTCKTVQRTAPERMRQSGPSVHYGEQELHGGPVR